VIAILNSWSDLSQCPNRGHLLALDCPTASGKTLGENIVDAEVIDDRVILPVDRPLSRASGTFVLRGSLVPDGCVIKPTAADPKLLKHTARARNLA